MKNFWSTFAKASADKTKLNKPILALAPMAGVTDSAFRELCRQNGADVVYTEMVSADGLFYDSKNTLEFLKFTKKEQPVVIQLFGKHPEKFTKAAQACEAAGFAGIDINFGCPAKKVTGRGGGVILMRDLDKCREIIKAVMAGTKLPVSVKLRSSINTLPFIRGGPACAGRLGRGNGATDLPPLSLPLIKGEKNSKVDKITALDFIRAMKDLPLAAVMVHGRSYEEPFTGPIDYEMIAALKKEFNGIVLGNGGIYKPEEAKIMLDKTGADGVGLARGLYGKPWLFGQIEKYLETGNFDDLDYRKIKKVMIEHARLAFKAKNKHGLIELRKHLCWYTAGWPGAAELRAKLVRVETIEEIKKILK